MKNLILLIVFALSMGNTFAQKQPNSFTFPIPQAPGIISNPAEQAAYVAQHYWDQFPFSNQKVVTATDSYEQQFADYVFLLNNLPKDKVAQCIHATLNKASKAKATALKTFVKLYEKYLYEPNSPMRNEELYIPVLQYVVASALYSDVEKIRPKHQLNLALRNRVGQTATDFSIALANGSKIKLSQVRTEYTVLFFNNPDCHDCKRVKDFMARSATLNRLIDSKMLTVFAVYPDEDLSIWKKTSYPSKWINGYDAGQAIQKQNLYDLKAIPCFYLLDVNKKVLLKDQTVEAIEQYLKR